MASDHKNDDNWWQEFTEGGSVDRAETTQMTRRERYARKFHDGIVIPAQIMWGDWRARIGLFLLAPFLFMGTVGRQFFEPPTTTGPRLVQPFETLAYPLGTDGLGQDILAYIVYSTQPIFLMIIGGGVAATALATVTGVTAGYKRGWTDTVLVNIMDVVIAIPGFPLVIVIVAIFRPENPLLIGAALSVNAWAGLARMIRAETLSIRENNYVEASQIMGVSAPRIMRMDLLPNLAPYVIMHFINMARNVIFHSVALFFLGVLPYMEYNWGLMMNRAYEMGVLYTWDVAHWLVMPMLAIILLTVSLTLIAQSLDNVFNPRIRARHMENDDGEPTTLEGGDPDV